MLDISGNTYRVSVTGDTGKTIKWGVVWQIQLKGRRHESARTRNLPVAVVVVRPPRPEQAQRVFALAARRLTDHA